MKEIRKYFELSRNETPFSNMKNVTEFLLNTKHSTTVLDIVILFFYVSHTIHTITDYIPCAVCYNPVTYLFYI